MGYHRFRTRSAFLRGKDAGTLEDWATAPRQGLPPRPGYRIIHLFPQTSSSFIPSIVMTGRQRVPTAVDRTDVESTMIRAPQGHLGISPVAPFIAPFEGLIMPFMRRGAMRVLREDLEVCENLQQHARQIPPDPTYGPSDISVSWFNDAYAEAMRASAASA